MLYFRVGRSPAIQFPTHAKHLHGCRTAAGVHVNLSQQTAILHADGRRSFEEAIDAARQRRMPEECTTLESAGSTLKT